MGCYEGWGRCEGWREMCSGSEAGSFWKFMVSCIHGGGGYEGGALAAGRGGHFDRRERPLEPLVHLFVCFWVVGFVFFGLGFRCGVQGVGCGVKDLGCGVQGSGFEVQGSGFRVKG